MAAMARDPSSIVNYQGNDEIDDSQLQVLWSKIMDKGKYRSGSNYQRVVALLLCWADDCSDLKTKKEVDRLKSVFVNRFNYEAQIEYLDKSCKKRLQVELNAKVASFVNSHDGPNTLFIVYYAGHGRPGTVHGDLEMFGQASPNDTKKRLDSIVWNKTEKLLEPAEADVLELFDCCYAGNLGLTKGPERAFEYLAACRADGTTKVPGKGSFTSALIFALEALVDKGRFTTAQLLKRIKEGAPGFPEDQHPVLYDRQKNNSRASRIMLHPIRKEGSDSRSTREDTPSVDPAQAAQRHTVTLHLDFSEKPSKTHIEQLGMDMNHSIDSNCLNVNRVRWGGMQSGMHTMNPMVVRALKGFKAAGQEGRKRRMTIPTGSNTNAGSLSPGPPFTPSLTNPGSSSYLGESSQGERSAELSTPGTDSGFLRTPQESNEDVEDQRQLRNKRVKRT